MFRATLAYKLAERGGRLIEVPPAYTIQRCARCGHVDAASRVNQARFVCVTGGHEANADINAAINIKRRADGPLKPVEGHRIKPARRSRKRQEGRLMRATMEPSAFKAGEQVS